MSLPRCIEHQIFLNTQLQPLWVFEYQLVIQSLTLRKQHAKKSLDAPSIFTYIYTNIYYIYWVVQMKISLNTKETTIWPKEVKLSLTVDTKTNLSLQITKHDHCAEKICVSRFYFISFWYGHLRSKSRYLLRMWRNLHQNGNTFHAMDVRLFLRYFDITVG